MTCIVGIAEGGVVYLGGDSASSTPEGEVFLPRRSKVFALGEIVAGVAGSVRINQLLRHKLSVPTISSDVERYMVVDFIDAFKALLKEDGRKDDELMDDSLLLVGVRGHLFVVDTTFQISEMACGYESIGSGAQIARGSLHATASLGLTPEERLHMALESAQQHSAFVRPPFTFVQTERDANHPFEELLARPPLFDPVEFQRVARQLLAHHKDGHHG